MSEKEIPRCRITLKKGETSGWKLEINDSSPECLASLEGIGKKLGRHGHKYLAKRIETSSPEVKKTLEKAGF